MLPLISVSCSSVLELVGVMLPDWAQKLSQANPILYMVNAFRYGFLGHSDVSVAFAFAVMLGAMIGLFALCVWLLDRGTGIRD